MEESKELQLDAKSARLLHFGGVGVKENAIEVSDRRVPRFAIVVSIIFSLTTNTIFFGSAVSVLFLFTLVADEGHLIVAPLVLAVLILPLLGTILVDWIYSWALTGIRGIREDLLAKSDGFVSFLGAILLGSIHPFLPIPALLSVLVAVIGFYILRKIGFLESSWDN